MDASDLKAPQELSDEQLGDVLLEVDVRVGGEDAGTMTFEFWPDAAPHTVRNFARYAAEGFYDGKAFHRVISGFMVQGGCPQGTGTGSGPRGTIPGEFSQDPKHAHCRGVLSMARAQDPDSASCQFFICHGDADFLDGQYAAFGCMLEGGEALDRLAGVETEPSAGGEQSKPAVPCEIAAMRLRPRP